MIKQAQTYLHGARLSVALLAAAVAAFVILGSLGGFSSFAVPGLGGDTSTPTLDTTSLPAQNAALVLNPGPAAPGTDRRGNGPGTNGDTGDGNGPGTLEDTASPGLGGGEGAGDGGDGPGTTDPETGDPDPGTGTGGSGTGTGTAQGSGAGSSTAGLPVNSNTVKNTVDTTVQTVDDATGGALSQAGVTQAVQGATNTLVGPDSSVGQAVDNTLGAVGNGLTGGK